MFNNQDDDYSLDDYEEESLMMDEQDDDFANFDPKRYMSKRTTSRSSSRYNRTSEDDDPFDSNPVAPPSSSRLGMNLPRSSTSRTTRTTRRPRYISSNPTTREFLEANRGNSWFRVLFDDLNPILKLAAIGGVLLIACLASLICVGAVWLLTHR